MKKAAVSSILVAVVLLVLGVIAEAQQPQKIPRIGFLSTQFASRPAQTHSVRVWVNWVTSRERTLRSSTDGQRAKTIGFPNSRRSWCGLGST
jgi:hypothetical protein